MLKWPLTLLERAHPDFHGMKQIVVLLLPLDGMQNSPWLVFYQIPPTAVITHLQQDQKFEWVE